MQKEKVRIYVLARELDMESKDLLAVCRQHGIDVKNQLSTIEPELCDQIKQLVTKSGGTATAAPPKPAVLPQVEKKITNLDTRRAPRPAVVPGKGPEPTETHTPAPAPAAEAAAAVVAPPEETPTIPATVSAPAESPAKPHEPVPVTHAKEPPAAQGTRAAGTLQAAGQPGRLPQPERRRRPIRRVCRTYLPASRQHCRPPADRAAAAAGQDSGSRRPPRASRLRSRRRCQGARKRRAHTAAVYAAHAAGCDRTAAAVPQRPQTQNPTAVPMLGSGPRPQPSSGPRPGGRPPGGPLRHEGRHRQPPRAPTHRVTPSSQQPGLPKPPPKPEEKKPAAVGGIKKLSEIPKALEGQGPINIQKILDHQREASKGVSAQPLVPDIEEDDDGKGKKGVKGGGGGSGGPKKPGELPGRADRHKVRQERQEKRKAHGDGALKVKSSTDLLEEDEPTRIRKPRLHPKLKKQLPTEKRKGKVPIMVPMTIRSFCEACGISAKTVLGKLMLNHNMENLNINSHLDPEMAETLAIENGIELDIKRPLDAEEEALTLNSLPDAPENLKPRAPIVTIMGHVDHGKTSLLDKIRGSRVVDTEAGGITQVIRAWRVDHNGHPITFLDTPGHEAFTKMRARGANVTDIAVIVVAVDDGVMPQTEEAINHAKAAGVSMIVALNKIDLPNANLKKTEQQLYSMNVLPDNMGGDTPFVYTSAATGKGIDDLLEAISLVAELRELKANPNRPGTGTCLEAYKTEGEGVQATLLVRNGTLKRGDVILCGHASGRVRAMYDDRGKPLAEAGPSVPVRVTGLDDVPNADDPFLVVDDLAKAAIIAEKRTRRLQEAALAPRRSISLETLSEAKITELKIILKAEARGSIEAIRKELEKLVHPELRVRVLEAAIGGITENDVWLALTSPQDTLILGFNVVPDERAMALAEERGVQIRQYNIIYNLTDDVRSALEGKLKPREEVVHLGRAIVRDTFKISKIGTIAGCYVTSGTIERSAKVRVIRSGMVIYPPADRTASLESLKRFKEDVREVRESFECGIKIANYDDIKVDDVIEAYRVDHVQRTLS